MATPEIATSHTKRISYAHYPSSPTAENTVDFYFRRGDVKAFDAVTLVDRQTAGATIEAKLDHLSQSPTRVILLNDETKVDMPEVTLDGLDRLVGEETVLGEGPGTQIFVIVYDQDPTAEAQARPKEAARVPEVAAAGAMKRRGWRGVRCVAL